ncbi:hypothetical protein B0H11DRAFT_1993727 [Mycena galericulata]|nr:hypothetical protein B0H11DRAFT_1993727 [Mycena galericulata]
MLAPLIAPHTAGWPALSGHPDCTAPSTALLVRRTAPCSLLSLHCPLLLCFPLPFAASPAPASHPAPALSAHSPDSFRSKDLLGTCVYKCHLLPTQVLLKIDMERKWVDVDPEMGADYQNYPPTASPPRFPPRQLGLGARPLRERVGLVKS